MLMASLSIVVFGITGDLSRGKVIPALFDLYKRGELPRDFTLVGYGRKMLLQEDFFNLIHDAVLNKNSNQDSKKNKREAIILHVKKFFKKCKYIQGELQQKEGYDRLRSQLDKQGRVIYFLSVHPELHITIINQLGGEKLLNKKSQIMVEKPFGHDVASAKKLDKALRKFINEDQVYRVDHYLGKVNLIEFLERRRRDKLFEKALQYELKEVVVKQWETKTIAGRGAFYDAVGAVKDVGQNHLLQMAAAVIGDKDVACRKSDRVQKARAAAINSLRLQLPAARAQYKGFHAEPGVKAMSQTETFFSIKAFPSLPQRKNVAISFSAGKALAQSKVEIEIFFKKPIKLKEGLISHLRVSLNANGEVKNAEVHKGKKVMEAYERILLAAIEKDQSFFCSLEESIAGWKFNRNVKSFWKKHNIELKKYNIGKLGITNLKIVCS